MSRVKREKAKSRKGTASDRHIEVHLTSAVEMLHEHITEALCQEVWKDVRISERERKWSLFALARFWLAAIIDAPPSLSQLLELMRKGAHEGFLPQVAASAESFFEKCRDLSSVFFTELHRRFIDNVLPKAPKCFAGVVSHLSAKFTDVLVIDGSRLDKIAHRLKILRKEKAVVLPGCILAVYDLFRGITRALWFDADAAASEFKRAELALQCLSKGSLVLGDRLYSSGVELFRILEQSECFGLFRRTKALPVRKLQLLKSESIKGGLLEDWLVEAGPATDPMKLRLIRLTKRKTIYEALTNVLDAARLSARDALDLYPLRWSVERLFFDLKIVLNLQRFYAANPNAVAMQVYAAAMVHAAFRIGQATVARTVKLPPEELSPQKLFALLAYVSIKLIEGEWYFLQICRANPGVKLRKPSWRDMPGTVVSLRYLRRQRRTGPRKARPYDPERGTWKSLRRIRGANKLT
jgi:IS4 transposase